MADNIPSTGQAGVSDLAHVDAALEGQGTIIGGLQSALAGAVDAQLAANQQVITAARSRLTKTSNKAGKGQAGMVNGLAGMLGETIAASIAPSEQAQQQIGAFAATRAVPPVLPRRATTGTATAPASGGAIPPPPPPPLPSPTLPTLTSGYLADPACLPQIQVDGQLGGTFPDPPDTANLPAGMDRWYIWTACNPPPNESQSHVHPTSAWIFEDPITHTSPAQRLINEGYIYLGYLNIGLSNQATQFPLANQIIAYYLQCACNPTGGGGGPPALPPIPPPALPPMPPPALPPALPPQQPPPVCVPPPPPPQISCGGAAIPDILDIGSPAFCASVKPLRQAFADLGRWIVSQVNDSDTPSGSLSWRSLFLASNPTTAPLPLVSGLWDAVKEYISDDSTGAMSRITGIVKCWWSALQESKSCNVSEIALLAVVKGVVDLLQRFRIGWDLAIWGTLDITVHIPQLLKVLDYLINDACNSEIPSLPEVVESYMQDFIGEDYARCLFSLHGANWDIWAPFWQTKRGRLTVEEFIQYGRRIGLAEQDIRDGLRSFGFLKPTVRQARLELYDELPSLSDVLHFLQRNVFDAQYVTDYGLMEGFAERFWPRYGSGLRAIGVTQQVAQDHYAAHWINPSIGQLAEMVMRLRPGRVDPTVQFTQQDFLRVLAEQDVAPFFRQRLLATAYRVLPLRQLNAATQQGRFNRAELIERWQDIGFDPSLSATMADTSLVTAARSITTAIHGFTPALVSQLAQYSLIDRPTANARLAPQGFTPPQVDQLFDAAQARETLGRLKKHDEGSVNAYATLALKAFEEGVIDRQNALDALANAGYSPLAAQLAVDTADLRQKMATIDQATKTIRKAFLLGELDPNEAANALAMAGIVPAAIPAYVQRWQLQLTVPRRVASGAQVLKWARSGILSIANARQRLLNLGYPVVDVDLQMIEVGQDIQKATALAAQRQAKTLALAQKAAQDALAKSQKQFCKLYTPARLIMWYRERIIDDNEFRLRLSQCGTSQPDADNLFKEATVARQAADKKAASQGAEGVEYTGPGAVP